MKPPVARKIPHAVTVHDHTRVDEYFWLRNREDPDVVAYLEAENAYALEAMKHTTAERDTIYHEMVARIQETDTSVPSERVPRTVTRLRWSGDSLLVVRRTSTPRSCAKSGALT